MRIKEEVFRLIKQIPKGKVATYGQIAVALKRQTRFVTELQTGFEVGLVARAVGNVLHQNRDPDVPCHRVVDRNGRIAKNYAFGGANVQRRRLILEGVKFIDKMHVDLVNHQWQ